MACTYAAVPKLANSDTWSSPPSIQWAPTVFRDSHQQGSQETYPQRARNPTPLRPEIIHGWASDIFPPSTIHTPSIRSVQIEDTIENIGEESVLPAQPSGGTPPEKSSKDENGQSG
jgi:hypothetical protein